MKKFLSAILATSMLLSTGTTVLASESETTTGTAAYTQTLATAASNFTVENGVITSYVGKSANVVIPDTIYGNTITGIASKAFQSCEVLETLELPSTITSIGESAFADCKNLTYVAFSEGLQTIGKNAFLNCSSLDNVWLPSSVTQLEEAAFSNTGLTSIFVPKTVNTMGYSVFQNCTLLKSVVFKASVSVLPISTFDGCFFLESIFLIEGITKINKLAFNNCSALVSITLPTTVTEIGTSAFFGCHQLATMDMSNTSLKTLNDTAFSQCFSLREVILPYGFTTFIKESTTAYSGKQFDNCTSLVKIVVPSTCVSMAFNGTSTNSNHTMFSGAPSNLTMYGYDGTAADKYANMVGRSSVNWVSLGTTSAEDQNVSLKPISEVADPTPYDPNSEINEIPTWAITFVNFVLKNEIMPDINEDNCEEASSRGLIALSIYNMCGEGEYITPKFVFTDVTGYERAVSWVYTNSIMTGTGTYKFGTLSNVTREQMSLILLQLARTEGKDENFDVSVLQQFDDRSSISSWATDGVAWAVGKGLMAGHNGNLNPNGNVTQVELAVMLYRFFYL